MWGYAGDCNSGNCLCEGGTNYEVVCYKCGNNALSCLVIGSPSTSDLAAIQGALDDNCGRSGTGNPRTCAEQQCNSGILTVVAPVNASGSQCLLSTGDGALLPLTSSHKFLHLHLGHNRDQLGPLELSCSSAHISD